METLVSITTNPANRSVTINAATGGQPEQAVYAARIENDILIVINTVTTIKRFSAPFNTVTIDGVTYADREACIAALIAIGNFKLGGGAIPSNNAGQIKVGFTGLSKTGFVADTEYLLPMDTATPTIAPEPTTTFPKGSATTFNPAMFIPGANPPTTMRLRENIKPGQVHRWRVIGSYANKSASNNGELELKLKNPDSGFVVADQFTLPSNRTTGLFTLEFITIADGDSLNVGKGYQLVCNTSFTDSNLIVNVSSITRMSIATENE